MTKFLIFNRQRFTAFLFYLFCIFLTILISGCGDGSYDSDSSETASAFFTIEWHDTPAIQSSENTRIAKALDCEDVGVDEITCDVYDGSSTYLTSGGPWPCSAGSGTIDNIPVGQGIEFVVLGFNGENIWYYGKTSNITITAGPPTNVGTIDAYSFVPSGLEATTVSGRQIDLSWIAPNENVSVAGYRIYRDGDQVGTSSSPSYSDTDLDPTTEYCYTVSAYDNDTFDNESGPSNQDCATTLESFDWYRDVDGDGYGDPNVSINSETQPEGYVSDNSDCNDNDASINPGATETCNGIDDDCDGNIDEGVLNTYYRDADGDGYGNAGNSTQACSRPSGYVTNSSDCNDNDASIHPGATEVCNGIDDDCDGNIDEGVLNTYYRDADGDGYGNADNSTQACSKPSGYVTNSSDCNDNDASIHPGATEVCNGIDDDCDGDVDDGLTFYTYYRDADGDGYGNAGNSTQACSMPSGYVTNSSDCNDNDASIHPGATEVCNGIDDDCDGDVDDGLTFYTYYRDADGDGYGNADNSTWACSRPSGYVTNSSDCNDNDASIHPGATEVCNGIDDDCDGYIDENCPPDLVITTGSPSVTPSSVLPGGTVTLSSWTVKNQGYTASGSFSNGFYLSTNSTITTYDTYLTGNSNYSLAPGEQFTWGGPTLTIPASTVPGTYYIGILVDHANEVAESNENNNYVSRQITVIPPPPDYTITSFSLSHDSQLLGLTVYVTYTAKNQGGSPNNCVNMAIFLSTNSIISTYDRQLEKWGLPNCNLSAGQSITQTWAVTIPTDITPFQDYYIGIIADVDDYESESNESNNTAAESIYIYTLL